MDKFVGSKPFRPVQTIAICMAIGCRIRGGGTVVLGEMDVARAKPKPRPGGNPSVRTAPGTHPSSGRRPPTVRATRGRLYPDGRRLPGPEYVGHRGWGIALG